MTPLRQKMIRAMELRNFAKNTQRGYLGAVKGLASYYRQSPDKLTKDAIEDYLLYLKNHPLQPHLQEYEFELLFL
jgi:hypothetical protein